MHVVEICFPFFGLFFFFWSGVGNAPVLIMKEECTVS